MNKKALLACLLAVMLLLSGCSLIVKDAAVDAATEIVRVGDTAFTKGDVQLMVGNYLASLQEYYAQNYGYSIDVTSADIIADAQQEVVNSLVESAVIEAKTKEMGVDTLPAEKQAEIDDLWNQYISLMKDMFLADSGLEGEELENAAAAYVYNMVGVTKESMEASEKQAALKALVVADVAVTDEEIQADFDSKVEAAKTSYASSLSAYGSAVNGGNTVYYRPEGYRMVKSILLKFKAVDSNRISALSAKATEQASAAGTKLGLAKAMEAAADLDVKELAELVTVEVSRVDNTNVTTTTDLTAVAEAGLDPVDFQEITTELTATTTDTLPADLDAELAQAIREYQIAVKLQEAYNAVKAEAIEAAYAHLDAAADEILAQLDAGADWNTLQAEKTEDPGMQSGVTAENGYAVCAGFTSFDSAYVAAAMELANVGDHTGKVRSDNYGYFTINYASDVAEGAVALADVKDGIQSELLTNKQNALYNETVTKWVSEAGAVIDMKSLNN